MRRYPMRMTTAAAAALHVALRANNDAAVESRAIVQKPNASQ